MRIKSATASAAERLNPAAAESIILSALQLAQDVYDGYAKDAEQPQRIREQWMRQARDARAVIEQIEQEALCIERTKEERS